MVPANGKIAEFKQFVLDWLLNNNKIFDQYINEFSPNGKSEWVHLAIKNKSNAQRKQYLLYKNGKYTSINPKTYNCGENVQSQSNIANNNETSTTNSSGNGRLVGKSIYYDEINIEAIKANNIFVKSESGEPTKDKNGNFIVSDNYLTEIDEHVADELENIDEIEKEPDETLTNILNSLKNENVETVRGIIYNEDGSYAISHSSTLQEIMKMFYEWWELVQILKKTSNNIKEAKENVETEIDDEKKLTINAELYIKSAFDKYGHAIREGMICPVCGKKQRFLPPGGYCSLECMLKDVNNKVTSFLLKGNDKYKEEKQILSTLIKLLNQMSLIINAITLIPNIIKDLGKLPQEYKDFVLMKINEGFCELQKMIQQLMILKNKLLTKLLKAISLGWISKPIQAIATAIQAIQEALKVTQEAFDTAYNDAMTVINSLKAMGMQIDAESFAWAGTPRSFISPLPYTAPDARKVFVNLPGGSGMQSIELARPLMPSALSSIDFSALDAAIQAIFPPLTPVDYYLEPELFDVRYLFSDQSDLVAQIRQQLEDFLIAGPDYLPKFENLLPVKKYTNVSIANGTIPELWLSNIGYIWFLLGLIDAWAPHSMSLVGSMLNPAI